MENKKKEFKSLALPEKVQGVLEQLGFTNPTEIQEKAIPLLLEKLGVDFHGQAQTGTGKTLAFGLPLLQRIDVDSRTTQALVLAPTRELALQIFDSLQPFVKALGISMCPVYGGVSIENQMFALKRGAQIVVGTPGRVNDHLRRRTLKIDGIKTLVLDEADIMLDMGFREEIDEVLTLAHDREIWLFSATVKRGIKELMKTHMKNPVSVRVNQKNVGAQNTQQYCCIVPMRARLTALCRFIESAPEFYGFVFCQTKLLAAEVADMLTRRGYHAGALHGDMSQAQRNAVIKKFKSRDYAIVVATDVAARGIDIQDLTHVVNYSLPEDHESYVHRIGRTGRAGKEGAAITFINKGEASVVKMLERKFAVAIKPIDVPSRDDIIKGRLTKASEYIQTCLDEPELQDKGKVQSLIDQYDLDELKTIAAYFLHEKYLGSIESDDVSFTPAAQFSAMSQTSQEMMLAVGTDDGLDRDAIVNFLVERGSVQEDQIKKIRVIKRRTFIEVLPDVAAPLFEALRNTSLGGRRTRVQFIDESQSAPNRGRSQRRSRPPFRGRPNRSSGNRSHFRAMR